MSTLAEIVAGAEKLPEESKKRVLIFVKQELNAVKPTPFAPLGREQIMDDIDLSERQLADGEGLDATQVLLNLGKNHGYI